MDKISSLVNRHFPSCAENPATTPCVAVHTRILETSIEPRTKKLLHSIVVVGLYRDPYNGLLQSPYNWAASFVFIDQFDHNPSYPVECYPASRMRTCGYRYNSKSQEGQNNLPMLLMEEIRLTTWNVKFPINIRMTYQPQVASLPDFWTINSP